MKKSILSLGLIILTQLAFAQAATLEMAQSYFAKADWTNAKKTIDEIMSNGKDDKNAAAWFTKGAIYQSIADDSKNKSIAPNGHSVAFDCYKKFMQLEKKLDIALAKNNMMGLLGTSYNSGISAYNDKKYNDAIASFDNVIDIKNSDESGKLFGSEKIVDTIVAQAKMYKAYSYFNDKKYNEAKGPLEAVIENSITKDADAHLRLASTYSNLNENDKWFAVIKKAMTAYPTNSDVKLEAVNYYITTNNQTEAAKLLEEYTATNKDPEKLFSLATTYENMLKETNPADPKALREKAIKTYERAALANPDNGDYVYNIGAIFYNQAVPLNDEMNKQLQDTKKNEPIKKNRDELMKKAQPYFEKAMAAYEKSNFREADKNNYNSCITALSKIYDIQKMTEKKDAVLKKMR